MKSQPINPLIFATSLAAVSALAYIGYCLLIPRHPDALRASAGTPAPGLEQSDQLFVRQDVSSIGAKPPEGDAAQTGTLRKSIAPSDISFLANEVGVDAVESTMSNLELHGIRDELRRGHFPESDSRQEVAQVCSYVANIVALMGESDQWFKNIPNSFSSNATSDRVTYRDVLFFYGAMLCSFIDCKTQSPSAADFDDWNVFIDSPNPLYRASAVVMLTRIDLPPQKSSKIWKAWSSETDVRVVRVWVSVCARSRWPSADTVGFLKAVRLSPAGDQCSRQIDMVLEGIGTRSQ